MDTIRITKKQLAHLEEHLFPGDGNEAVAVALCGRHQFRGEDHFCIHKMVMVPHEDCKIRLPGLVDWPTSYLWDLLPEAKSKGFAIAKIHSHPTGHAGFSPTDDRSDNAVFDAVFGSLETEEPHLSMIMLPDKQIIARKIMPDLAVREIDQINVIGHSLSFQRPKFDQEPQIGMVRNHQVFGDATMSLLSRLRVGVVGCSGTGSHVIEQLYRLGVGELVIIDPETIGLENLNRMIGTGVADAEKKLPKVDHWKRQIQNSGLATKVISYQSDFLTDPLAFDALAACDVIFGCTDNAESRNCLNRISTFYLQPYFDMGVRIDSDGNGGVDSIAGSVHFIRPGGDSLLQRGQISVEDVIAESLARSNPEEYKFRRESGYIRNLSIQRPAVISLNGNIASLAIMDFLNRLHPFSIDEPEEVGSLQMSFTDFMLRKKAPNDPDPELLENLGRGRCVPLLQMPVFS